MPAQPSASGMDRILFYGNLCVDHVFDVPAYPKENTGQRAVAARKTIGGNGGNSTRVLKQLRGMRSCVSWLGPVPRVEESDTIFALAALQSSCVDTVLLEEVGGDALPSSLILCSQQTGSRTIVSTRHGVPELSVSHFGASVKAAFAEASEFGKPCWCHIECRQPPEVMMQFAVAWRAEAQLQSPIPPLSVEVEKPAVDLNALFSLLKACDYAFFSQEFVEENHHKVVALAENIHDSTGPETKRQKLDSSRDGRDWERHIAVAFMSAMNKCVGQTRATWVCTWGNHGAFALDTSTCCVYFESAHAQREVLDSVGAGDTFIATCIHALLLGSDIQQTLNCACAVAGRKVAQVGFSGLADALPLGMR